jgi:hypothetical protein
MSFDEFQTDELTAVKSSKSLKSLSVFLVAMPLIAKNIDLSLRIIYFSDYTLYMAF